MKRYAIMLLTLMVIFLTSCSSQKPETPPANTAPVTTPTNSNPPVSTPTPESSNKPEAKTMTISEFDEFLATQPLPVIDTQYSVQDEKFKSLYPDFLQAIIQNNTESDIKDVVFAYVAWDENNLPIKIKSNIDLSDGAYIKKCLFSDINLVPGQTFGSDTGMGLDEGMKIKSFKAIVANYETFDGITWDNPYFEAFCQLYEGKKFSDDLKVDVVIKGAEPKAANTATPPQKSTASAVDGANLEEEAAKQPLAVTQTKYVIQDEKYKSLYPDMLQAILINNSQDDIKDAVVAFAAWDENNLPIKLKGNIDFSDGAYIKEVNFEGINLVPGKQFGSNNGFSVDENLKIKNFKAIVVSYKTFDDKSWENPLYKDFRSLYEGKKLS